VIPEKNKEIKKGDECLATKPRGGS